MTREEMMEFFNNKVTANNTEIPEEAYDYINEKIDTLPEGLKRYNALEFYDELKSELNGENGEMARRMLMVISKVNYYPVGYCNIKTFANIKDAILIGYGFYDILNETFLRDRIYFDWCYIGVIDILYDSFKSEMEEYAHNLLNRDLAEFYDIKVNLFFRGNDLEKRKVLEFFTQIICAVTLYKNDNDKYKKYIDVVIEYFKNAKLKLDLSHILFRIYKYDSKLLEILKYNVLNNHFTCKSLDKENLLKFLQENNMKKYPYYYLIARDFYSNSKREQILKELFVKDKTTFYETYEFVKNDEFESSTSMYMLAIMIKNDEAKEILESDRKRFTGYADELAKRMGNSDNYFDLVINNKEKAKELCIERLSNKNGFRTREYESILEIFSLLFDYEEHSHDFVDFNLKIFKELNYIYNLCSLIDSFLRVRNKWLDLDIKEELNNLIRLGYIDIFEIFKFLCVSRNDYVLYNNYFTHEFVVDYTKNNVNEALEFFDNDLIKNDIDKTLIWLEQVYNYAEIKDYDIILKFLSNKSKKIRDFCEDLIVKNEDTLRVKLEANLKSLKGEGLKTAKRIIKSWDNDKKYGKDFAFENNDKVIEFVTDNYDKANERITKFIDESYFVNVRFKDSETKVPSKVIRFILNEYMALSQVYRIKSCDKIIEKLNISDFRNVISNLYNEWLESGADTKKKNIAVPYCIYSSDSDILNLRKQLEDFAKNQRSIIASYLVNAIALNASKVSLMMVENIGNKFPNAKVKSTAKDAFKYAAKVLSVPEDVLSDKIVPSLEFDKYGERVIDYGNRTFKVTLMEDFTLSIFDNEKNKIIKSLPKPNNSDDKEKAESAKKEFTALKKQLKAVVKTQSDRLKVALTNGRAWDYSAWNELFIENPIMQMFARKLIWGVYDKDNNILATFRYMEDGSFNTSSEEEYDMPKDLKIALAHTCELSQEEINEWKTQLEDYEINQPLDQINVKPIYLEEEEKKGNTVVRYVGKKTTSGKLAKLYKDYNLLRGEVLDGGGVYCYHYIDKYLNCGVQLNFEGMSVAIYDYNEEIELNKVVFYKLDEDFDDTVDDEIDEKVIISPDSLPNRFVCSIISIFDKLVV